MLATEVQENIYLNVTKLAVPVLPLGPGRTFPGFEVDGQQCQPIARGWAVPGRQVQLGAVSESAQACLASGLGFVRVCVNRQARLPPHSPPQRERMESFALAPVLFPPRLSDSLSLSFCLSSFPLETPYVKLPHSKHTRKVPQGGKGCMDDLV